MNANIKNIPADDFSVDFEVERTPVRLGNSDRYFYMDFNDTNFPSRLKQAREEIAEYLENKRSELGIDTDDIQNYQSKERSTEEIEQSIKHSRDIDQYIKERINYIFGYDISSDVFGCASSISVTRKGDYYFDSFLNSVLPLVEREYGVRIKTMNEKLKKYTDRKGMHPAVKKCF